MDRWCGEVVERDGPLDGGEQLRRRIQAVLNGTAEQPGAEPLAFRGTTEIEARSQSLSVQLDAMRRSWALATDLLDCYGLYYAWDGERRRMLIGALDVAPTYRDDAVQADVGCPRFEMSLQAASAPVILVGIIRSSF